jgi:hypothetical protein
MDSGQRGLLMSFAPKCSVYLTLTTLALLHCKSPESVPSTAEVKEIRYSSCNQEPKGVAFLEIGSSKTKIVLKNVNDGMISACPNGKGEVKFSSLDPQLVASPGTYMLDVKTTLAGLLSACGIGENSKIMVRGIATQGLRTVRQSQSAVVDTFISDLFAQISTMEAQNNCFEVVDLRVIEQEEEGTLASRAALAKAEAAGVDPGNAATWDLGGASTQIRIYNDSGNLSKSLDCQIGAEVYKREYANGKKFFDDIECTFKRKASAPLEQVSIAELREELDGSNKLITLGGVWNFQMHPYLKKAAKQDVKTLHQLLAGFTALNASEFLNRLVNDFGIQKPDNSGPLDQAGLEANSWHENTRLIKKLLEQFYANPAGKRSMIIKGEASIADHYTADLNTFTAPPQ